MISCDKEPILYNLNISADPSEGGNVIVENDKYQYKYGELAKITAIPNDEYSLKSWKGSNELSTSINILIEKDTNIVANFVKKRYNLEIEINGNGKVEQKIIKHGTVTDYTSGSIVELTAMPDLEWKFKNWEGDINSNSNPIQVTIDKSKDITVNFEQLDLIQINVKGHGSYTKKLIDFDNGEYTYHIEAFADSGWSFVRYTNNINYYQEKIEIKTKTQVELDLEFTNNNEEFNYYVEDIVNSGSYGVIWGMDLLEENKLIFTSRDDVIYLVDNNNVYKVDGFPYDEVNSWGQGGLLDIKTHPQYKSNGWIYLVYTQKNQGFPTVGSNLKLIRFKLEGTSITNIETIFTIDEKSTGGHFGSRISFDDNFLYLSVGEGSSSYGGKNTSLNNAQKLNTNWGKIHRLNYDGSVPYDNPSFNNSNNKSIFSYGHRNPQGLAYDPYSKHIISTEHGPKGGDEINIIKSGLNYGWPYVSFGINYDDSDISGKKHEGYEKPIYYWDPSIATSNLILLNNINHKSWFRTILVCGLRSEAIHRLKFLDDGNLIELSPIVIGNGQRVRNIINGNNADFYVSTDTGRIMKFSPI